MMTSTLRHALVTGGAGFIGSHLVRELLARGRAVSVLDDLSVGPRRNVPSAVRFIEGDVRDADAVDEALQGVDCVFHNAAIVSVRASVEDFSRDADVNLMGTLNLLERMGRARVRKAVLASSMAVYADRAEPLPLPESHPTVPLSPYGIAKLAAERYWMLLCPHFGIEGTVLRYFNTYGPGQTLTPYVGVITIFINRLLAGQPPVVFGDGEQRRDFVHVDDVVAANLLTVEGDAASRILNVGTGRATSVNEIACELTALLAPDLKPIHEAAQPGEVRNAVADISAIREALGFEPRRPRLELAEVIRYWRDAREAS
ncbi:MAG: SDR family NAD(P)-dependent oxidoreductase [Myxococcota bacterium]